MLARIAAANRSGGRIGGNYICLQGGAIVDRGQWEVERICSRSESARDHCRTVVRHRTGNRYCAHDRDLCDLCAAGLGRVR